MGSEQKLGGLLDSIYQTHFGKASMSLILSFIALLLFLINHSPAVISLSLQSGSPQLQDRTQPLQTLDPTGENNTDSTIWQ